MYTAPLPISKRAMCKKQIFLTALLVCSISRIISAVNYFRSKLVLRIVLTEVYIL